MEIAEPEPEPEADGSVSRTTVLRFRWRIENFKQCIASSESYYSPEFEIFPNCCSIYLKVSCRCLKLSRSRSIDADHLKNHHGILSKNDAKVGPQDTTHSAVLYFTRPNGAKRCSMQYDLLNRDYMEFDVFPWEENLENGFLTVGIDLTLVKESHPPQRNEPEDTNMVPHLERLLSSKMFSDFEIRTSKEIFKVHKCILATRSPYFEAMFRAQMKESLESSLDLSDIDEVVVSKLIQFTYANKLELSEDCTEDIDLAIELLKMADLWQLDELKLRCELSLIEKMIDDNVVTMLKVAQTHKAEALRDSAIKLISQNEKFLSILLENPVEN